MSRRTSNFDLTSSSHINPPHTYNYNTSLGQSSLMVNQNVGLCDSITYMNRRPTYDLSHTESNFLPTEFSNGMLPLMEEPRRSIFETSSEFQAPRFGQYGTTSEGLGMNSNLSTEIVGSNYNGNRISEYGNLLGSGRVRVNGYDDGSLGGVKVHGTSNANDNGNGSPGGVRVHATDTENGNGSSSGIRVFGSSSSGGRRVLDDGSLGGVKVHGTSNANDNDNGSLGGVRVRATDVENGNGSSGGIRVFGNGSSGKRKVVFDYGSFSGMSFHDTDSLGGIRIPDSGSGSSNGNVNGSVGGTRLHGSGNADGSLGENVVGQNWNPNNNISNHGSSTSRSPSASLSSFLEERDQSHDNFVAQTDDVVPVQENPSMLNDHHGPNEGFSNTVNSQFDQNQFQDEVTGINFGEPTDHDLLELEAMLSAHPVEDIDTSSFNNGDFTGNQLNSNAAHPLEDIDTLSFNNGDFTGNQWNPNAAYSEMDFLLQDMNTGNHGNRNEEFLNSMAVNPEIYFPPQDMNITNQGNEELLNSMAVNTEVNFPPQDINITNQGYYSEEMLNYDNAASSFTFPPWPMNTMNHGDFDIEPLIADTSEMYFSPPDMNITNQDRGVADLADPPLSFLQDPYAEGDNYLLEHVVNPIRKPKFA
ncbi:unnamed protein product [Microthlaspi erraticum]|uniref:Uncharacterized protein n=1 Tax=Microthlaspi erraticum TaxID=1685480 RepID=A0A6D2I7Z8_9BRAS|nr:unnamed protein product [Microthlaspi erraticum]